MGSFNGLINMKQFINESPAIFYMKRARALENAQELIRRKVNINIKINLKLKQTSVNWINIYIKLIYFSVCTYFLCITRYVEIASVHCWRIWPSLQFALLKYFRCTVQIKLKVTQPIRDQLPHFRPGTIALIAKL